MTPKQVDALDYWDAVRNFPAAFEKRRAQERLDAITDRVMLQGASGKTIEYDAQGRAKPETRGKANTFELVDFAAHLRYLERVAGHGERVSVAPEPPKSRAVEQLNALAKIFGGEAI